MWLRWLVISSTMLSILFIPISSAVRNVAAEAVVGPELKVNVQLDRHAISPDIYGMNSYGVDAAFARSLHIPVQRWGGDGTTRYNWLVDSSNAGADWYFTGGNGQEKPTPGASADAFVRNDQQVGSKSILTLPIIGYVNATSAWNCSFPVSKYGEQQAVNPYVHPQGQDCGNGLTKDGKPIQDTDPLLNHRQTDPSFMQDWIKHLISVHGTAAQGGVQIYEMDNEPGGWNNTHRDVHPDPTGYDELVTKTTAYATMVKETDPTASVLGPSDFGWPVYLDSTRQGDNAASHNNVKFAEYYLRQMHAYEQQHGVRILDYFDEHYYPNEAGVANSTAGDANTQALRLRSTRSLWDPTYKDESWIGQYYPPIQLLRLFHSWVNADYPGTKIALTEYNWGGLESLNGALAQADVLGIFGRENIDLATLWGPPTARQPGAYAFRMYLNYDGKGSRYGDTWIQSSSADQGQLAIYGAQRSHDGAVTLMLINKTDKALNSHLTLSGFQPAAQAQVYSYSAANLNAIVRQPDQTISAGGFTMTYPANSITLLVLPNAAVAANGQQGQVVVSPAGSGQSASPHSVTPQSLYHFVQRQPLWRIELGIGGVVALCGIVFLLRRGRRARVRKRSERDLL